MGNEEGEVGLELGRGRGRGSVDGRGVEDGDTILQSSPTSLSSLKKMSLWKTMIFQKATE